MGVAAFVIALAALTLLFFVIVFLRLIIHLILCFASLNAQVLVKALEDTLYGLVAEELLQLLWADFFALQNFIVFYLISILIILVINISIVIIIVSGWLLLHHLLGHD